VERISDKEFNGLNTIKFESLCKKLINLVDPVDEVLRPELSLVGVTVLRKMIEMENKDLKTVAAEWDSADYEDYSKKIEERQDKLTELGVVDMICNMITADVSEDLKNEAILLGIAVLLGGNNNAQKAFFEYMQNDKKNNMMVQLNAMINKLF
jgi:hypothetical protein